MKVGDLVRWKKGRILKDDGAQGVVVSELRHGINSSFVDVLVDGKVVPVNWKALEVLRAR
tara:strand:- start:119 stop:298 length:180 start_codon:yes stop_codon:yes gene_type:complete